MGALSSTMPPQGESGKRSTPQRATLDLLPEADALVRFQHQQEVDDHYAVVDEYDVHLVDRTQNANEMGAKLLSAAQEQLRIMQEQEKRQLQEVAKANMSPTALEYWGYLNDERLYLTQEERAGFETMLQMQLDSDAHDKKDEACRKLRNFQREKVLADMQYEYDDIDRQIIDLQARQAELRSACERVKYELDHVDQDPPTKPNADDVRHGQMLSMVSKLCQQLAEGQQTNQANTLLLQAEFTRMRIASRQEPAAGAAGAPVSAVPTAGSDTSFDPEGSYVSEPASATLPAGRGSNVAAALQAVERFGGGGPPARRQVLH